MILPSGFGLAVGSQRQGESIFRRASKISEFEMMSCGSSIMMWNGYASLNSTLGAKLCGKMTTCDLGFIDHQN